MRENPGLLRSAASISLATLVSRLLGLLRDQVQSYYFGASVVTDAFLAAFRIPNLLRDLFAEGALSSAFVPTFTAERENRGEAAAWRLANLVITALAAILGVLSLVILLAAPAILRVYTPGFEPEKFALAVTMTRILSPFLLCVALAAVAMGVLNTWGRFFLPALAPAVFNVCAILGVIVLVPVLRRVSAEAGLALAIGAMVGGVLQFLVQVPSLRALGFRFVPRLDLSDPGLRRVAWLMLPATFGLAATQINILVDTALASWCQDGAITWLSLAFRLMQLPIGLFGVAIASANLARVSKDAARGDVAALRSNLAAALRTAALLTLPATAGLIALRVPIVRVLFEHGGVFTRASTLNTASAVLCYAVGLFAYSVTKVQVPTFYALGDTRWPVASSAVAVGLKILVNLALLVLLPREQLFMGLALTTSLAAWANLALLSIGLRRKAGSMRGLGVLPTAGKLALLSVVVGVASSATQAGLEHLGGAPGVGGEIFRLLVSILAGTMVAGGGALALGVPEAEILFRRITGFDRRRSRR